MTRRSASLAIRLFQAAASATMFTPVPNATPMDIGNSIKPPANVSANSLTTNQENSARPAHLNSSTAPNAQHKNAHHANRHSPSIQSKTPVFVPMIRKSRMESARIKVV